MDMLLGLCLGIGLAAACGFRVFVPLLVINLAARAGHLDLATGFEWMGSDLAMVVFLIATVLEVTAYYVPWLDNALDGAATPAAVIAGSVITASFVTDMHPLLGWSLAIIAGGGAAAAVQGVTVIGRAASTATTGGLANPAVSTVEAGASIGMSLLAIVLPAMAAMAVLLIVFLILRKLFGRRQETTIEPAAPPVV